MKIWKAELILFLNDNGEYKTKFIFETDNKEYEVVKERQQYCFYKDWVADIIPMNMKVDYTYCSDLKVEQGFERELSKEELEELEIEMKSLLKKTLQNQKEIHIKKYIEEYNKKIGGLQ